MRLLDKLNRKVGDKEYRKYFLHIPNNDVDKLQWTKGQELDVRIRGDTLILKPAD